MFDRSVAVFHPQRLLASPNFDVALSDTRDLHKLSGDLFDRWPFMPILCVTLDSGDQLFVHVILVNDWIVAIEEARANRKEDSRPNVS